MLLIATDEAGYGPKLGPLVIVATAWELPDLAAGEEYEAAFAPLRSPRPCGQVTVAVDDSKAVYRPGKGLDVMHAMVSASHHQCGRLEGSFIDVLHRVAANDWADVQAARWLCDHSPISLLRSDETQALRDWWSHRGAVQVGTEARIITAARFNRVCRSCNKADLLSEATLGLVHSLLQKHQDGHARVVVHCDRHGGRRYYAGVLQHVFEDSVVQAITETKSSSSYQLSVPMCGERELRVMSSTTTRPTNAVEDRPIDDGIGLSDRAVSTATTEVTIHFTVKGDSFAPVALSSIHAKYVRERFMESFNRFFSKRYIGDVPLKPTAGYPVDADRYLEQIQAVLKRESIAVDDLVRTR